MEADTLLVALDDGSEIAINVKRIAYVHFFPASVGGKAHAEIYFDGRDKPLAVGESVAIQLRSLFHGRQ